MHPRLAELVEYAQLQREAMLAAVSTVPESMRSRRPDSATWSVAEVLEHVHRVESGIARMVGRGIQKARAAGAPTEHEVSSLMNSLDALQLRDRSRFARSPESMWPRGELSAEQAVAALGASRQQLLLAIGTGDGLALGGIEFPHPLLGNLNLYQWILFVAQHEGRHSDQIRAIGLALLAPSDHPTRRK